MKKVESRYSLIKDGSRPEEIVLLQGKGCFWKKCAFCDYYLDTDSLEEIVSTNKRVINEITGETGRLTVLNSGSFFELPKSTIELILETCKKRNIKDLTIESHWFYRDKVDKLKKDLANFGINLHPRIGIETFDTDFRENVLKKGIFNADVKKIAESFDECCLIFGISGQNLNMLKKDISLALENFKDVYLNIYEEIPGLKKDNDLIEAFKIELLPHLTDERLHILINNTDLGVG